MLKTKNDGTWLLRCHLISIDAKLFIVSFETEEASVSTEKGAPAEIIASQVGSVLLPGVLTNNYVGILSWHV